MQRVLFVVDEDPHACWDLDLSDKNLEFLQGIDAGFFEYTARLHAGQLDGDEKLRAALGIRVAYSQGLETLFALLCSGIQAPQCVAGWMTSYWPSQLVSLVRKISARQVVYSRLNGGIATWESMSAMVHRYLPYDADKKQWIEDGFARFWARLAHEFTDELLSEEYNAAKHGLRTKLGGFALAFGAEKSRGVQPPPETMELIGESEFGTSFFRRQPITDRLNFRLRRVCRNWDPVNLGTGLLLISMSITNVASFLRIVNGEAPNKCRFENPEEPAAFDEPWKRAVGVEDLSIDLILNPSDIRPCRKEEILRSYEQERPNGSDSRE